VCDAGGGGYIRDDGWTSSKNARSMTGFTGFTRFTGCKTELSTVLC
jgi:hypothetical protein